MTGRSTRFSTSHQGSSTHETTARPTLQKSYSLGGTFATVWHQGPYPYFWGGADGLTGCTDADCFAKASPRYFRPRLSPRRWRHLLAVPRRGRICHRDACGQGSHLALTPHLRVVTHFDHSLLRQHRNQTRHRQQLPRADQTHRHPLSLHPASHHRWHHHTYLLSHRRHGS